MSLVTCTLVYIWYYLYVIDLHKLVFVYDWVTFYSFVLNLSVTVIHIRISNNMGAGPSVERWYDSLWDARGSFLPWQNETTIPLCLCVCVCFHTHESRLPWVVMNHTRRDQTYLRIMHPVRTNEFVLLNLTNRTCDVLQNLAGPSYSFHCSEG